MRAIVGLGNPGSQYERTRHNAGFMVVDALAHKWQLPKFKHPWRWRARVTEGSAHGERVVLVKPQTYMNRSGAALGRLLEDAAFDPARDLLVVVDEVALPLGVLRIRRAGSAGGHNGLKSIAGRLQSEQFPRLRIGVGPPPEESRSDYVLGEFRPDEWEALHATMPTIVAAVECWLTEGIETAMNRFNRRGTESD